MAFWVILLFLLNILILLNMKGQIYFGEQTGGSVGIGLGGSATVKVGGFSHFSCTKQ